MVRTWGPWTEVKLDALGDYLGAFCVACSLKAKRTLYLDLFAGAPENESRETGRMIANSAERALQSRPPFTRVVLCEMASRAVAALEDRMREKHPERDVKMLPGDCNETLPAYLAVLGRDRDWRWAPAFAFVDQFSAEIRWETLETLAHFRLGTRKVELWMLFGDSFIPRGAYEVDGQVKFPEYLDRVDAMFGTSQWREMRQGQLAGWLEPHEFRAELVNLMRWRLEKDLGYSTTIALKFPREDGHELYTMIFATDSDVGDKIMRHIFKGAGQALDDMIARAKAVRKSGRSDDKLQMDGLFAVTSELIGRASPGEQRSTLDPPVEPWRLADHLRDT